MGHSAAVLGASGYAGGEILRLLFGHPGIEVAVAAGGQRAGALVASIHPHLAGTTNLELTSVEEALGPADVVFSCLPPGQLRERSGDLEAGVVVDLSDDFRGAAAANAGGSGVEAASDAGPPRRRGSGVEAASDAWVYGLTEYARPQLAGATRIANPGCYPTASLLALLPFARAGAIDGPVVIDALSGISGAGRRAEDRLLFCELASNATAYGSTQHRHVPEIEAGLAGLGKARVTVSFTPHLVPLARGLLVTARAPLARPLSDGEALGILADAYASEPFLSVLQEWPQTKSVCGTNRALLSARVDARNDLLVCSAAIDNLGKGAAGQAVQNANVALGLDETLGLAGLGVWP